MSNAKKAAEYLNEALKIQSESAGWYRQIMEAVRAEKDQIKLDPNLSEKGRLAKVEELKEMRGIELMQALYTRKQEFIANLTKAQKMAERSARVKPKKLGADELERFHADFKKLKTNLTLETRPHAAEERLTDFVTQIKDEYLAEIVHGEFEDVASRALAIASGQEALAMRKRLANMYEKLETDFMSTEKREALRVLEQVNYLLENPNVLGFSKQIIMDSVGGTYGTDLIRFLDKPEVFFMREGYEKHRPADYTDEEIKEIDGKNENMRQYREMNEKIDNLQERIKRLYG